jgi:outer membrane protein assembly factor BamB
MLALVLAALAASAPGARPVAAPAGIRATLPPAPRALYSVAWQRGFVTPSALEWRPMEPGGVAVDATTGIAVFGTRDGWLHALRPDGTVAWEYRAGGAFPGPPAVDGDTVYVGSSEGTLHAIALGTGKARWRYESKEELGTRPVVAGGLVYVSSLQDTLFAVDARTGEWRWHHRREAREEMSIRGAAAPVMGAGAVYAAYSDGFVAALDPQNGRTIWERLVAPPGEQMDVDGLAIEGGRLFAAAYSGAVVALEAESGKTVWTFKAPGAVRVAVAGGVVVAATLTTVHGLSPGDGTPLWSAPLRGAPWAEPVAAGKWILVPAGLDGGLIWLEGATGRTLRVFEPGTGVSGSPAVLGRRAYVLSNGGQLFALDLS